MKRIFFSFAVVVLLFQTALAQSAEWKIAQLPGDLPLNYQYGVGETCIIFADDTSQSVYLFDINYGDWQTVFVPTQLEWIDAAADGNVAMIYNDSIVIGYSAITSSFSTLAYSGSLINLSGEEYGCIDNFAFFVTNQLFYVFDAEDAQWHSFSYTGTGSGQDGGVKGKDDYLYLDLWSNTTSAHSIVAYSLQTKSFSEFSDQYIYINKELDHGFVFIRNSISPYLCGGYSAITGQFKSKTHTNLINHKLPEVYEGMVFPLVCFLSFVDEPIGGNNYRHTMWVYNTLIGDFAENTFEYSYNSYRPVDGFCGGQNAFVIIRNLDQADKLECLLYNAQSNTFSLFDTQLFFWTGMPVNFRSGGMIFDGYDFQNYFVYDIITATSFTYPVDWSGTLPDITAWALASCWSTFVYNKPSSDSVYFHSYCRDYNNFTTFATKGNSWLLGFYGSDFLAMRVDEAGLQSQMFMYVHLFDKWTAKDLTSASYFGGEGNYFYINYPNLSQIYFYDGQIDGEYYFQSPQLADHVIARDSVFVMYSADGKYIGYSMSEHNYNEFTMPRLSNYISDGQLILNLNLGFGSKYEHLLYDGYSNTFATLLLTLEQGSRVNAGIGGRTALVMSQHGYLFAYYPGGINPVEEDQNYLSNLSYTLEQNFPNPFNPSTKIQFAISSGQFVILKVYDILGNEVITLVNEKKPAGEYEVKFDGIGLSSGIYFYQLKAGGFIQTKKMVLLR